MLALTAAELRAECYAFRAQYDTPNVRAAIEHAESGRLAWREVHALLKRALGDAIVEVA